MTLIIDKSTLNEIRNRYQLGHDYCEISTALGLSTDIVAQVCLSQWVNWLSPTVSAKLPAPDALPPERYRALGKTTDHWQTEIERLQQLIGELADALYDHMGFNTKRKFTQDEELVLRAREAIK